MKYCGITNVGVKRKTNQDSYGILSGDAYLSVVVCDGMGGSKGGNIASNLAVKTYTNSIKESLGDVSCILFGKEQIKDFMIEGVNKANAAVFEAAGKNPDLEGMGTTLVAVIVSNHRAYAVNVGDSRLYEKSGDVFRQVSNDHSFVCYLLEKGLITAEEAQTHPNKNIILRALGVNETVECDFFCIDEFDKLLLCTDGLTNHVSDDEINEIISGAFHSDPIKPLSYRKRVEKLVEAANNNGGSDNITAVLVGD